MNPQTRPASKALGRCIAHVCFLLLVCWSAPLRAQGPSAGTIEGRVTNPATGAILPGVRLRVEGTSIEASTDADGNYRLQQVPAGSAKVSAFFTGSGLQTETVDVVAGRTSQRDFQLSPSTGKRPAGGEGEAIKLDNFVIAASRVMSGAALAINEQRFAPNMKNVVSADEFGDVPEGNVAEFLKFMPGVSVDVTGGHARASRSTASRRTMCRSPSMASASRARSVPAVAAAPDVSWQWTWWRSTTCRGSRFRFPPTPESEGSALAGSINLVPRSSFERSRPELKSSVFLLLRDNAKFLGKSQARARRPTRSTRASIFPTLRP